MNTVGDDYPAGKHEANERKVSTKYQDEHQRRGLINSELLKDVAEDESYKTVERLTVTRTNNGNNFRTVSNHSSLSSHSFCCVAVSSNEALVENSVIDRWHLSSAQSS